MLLYVRPGIVYRHRVSQLLVIDVKLEDISPDGVVVYAHHVTVYRIPDC